MTKRIFRAIFNVSLLILIASTLILVAFVGDYNSDQTKEAMHADAVYIAKAMETEGISYLEQLPKQSQRTHGLMQMVQFCLILMLMFPRWKIMGNVKKSLRL